ncbi:hypothetical protein BKA62DRAFT_692297 [Auriculariales sp. MPI-PUGE-AT-0066]|nr:hypothetical protein BKA62DRAFT_692297 [Auriculariales sp. MPI-PUGE-AT-0066]
MTESTTSFLNLIGPPLRLVFLGLSDLLRSRTSRRSSSSSLDISIGSPLFPDPYGLSDRIIRRAEIPAFDARAFLLERVEAGTVAPMKCSAVSWDCNISRCILIAFSSGSVSPSCTSLSKTRYSMAMSTRISLMLLFGSYSMTWVGGRQSCTTLYPRTDNFQRAACRVWSEVQSTSWCRYTANRFGTFSSWELCMIVDGGPCQQERGKRVNREAEQGGRRLIVWAG